MIEDQGAHGCTLMIAHRLSTLKTCDRIIVMDKGSIKESGSHADLMNIEVVKDVSGGMKTGWYRDLYETQHGKSDKDGKLDNLKAVVTKMKQELSERWGLDGGQQSRNRRRWGYDQPR